MTNYYQSKIKDALYKVKTGYWTIEQALQEILIISN